MFERSDSILYSLKTFIFAILCSLCLWACAGGGAPDVSGIKVEIKSRRFDLDMAKLDTNNLAAGLQTLRQQYPVFLDLYLDKVMGFRVQGDYTDSNPAISQGVRGFLTDKDYRSVFDTVKAHFPDTKTVDEDMEKGFKYMKHYFPDFVTPDITYFVGGLTNWGVFLYGQNSMAIGLDMFLGEQYPHYRSVGLQNFLYRQFIPEYIPVAAFRAIYQDMYPDVVEEKTLLDLMLQRGKEQYFLSKVLPYKAEHIRLAYTEDQLEGCEENEGHIYNFFVQKDLLYAKTMERIYPFVNEGPATKEISDECPGNIGTWLGYRIVSSYMKEHPQTSLEQLFKMTDSQRFLLESKYKPK
jgi:hypothetical protein